jgi:hypothetical protein
MLIGRYGRKLCIILLETSSMNSFVTGEGVDDDDDVEK